MKFVLFLLFSFNLMAQSPDPRQDKTHPCTGDFPLFCKDEVPSDANYWNCLGKKMNVLSPKCTEFMEGIYKRLNPCGKEILDYCPGKKKNYGNWSACLIERKSEVSGKCSKMLGEIVARYERGAATLKACSKDQEKHCKSLDPRQCMMKIRQLPENELSAECKAKLATVKSH